MKSVLLICLQLLLVLLVQSRSLLPCQAPAGSCGNWQAEYSRLHQAISSGTAPPRRLVSVPVKSGFADRMIGSVTAMLFALLSDRAIYFETQTANGEGELRPLTDVFTADTVDWSLRHATEEAINYLKGVSPTNEDADAIKQYSFGVVPGDNSSYFVSMVNGWGAEHLFTTVLQESAGYDTVYITLNRGMTVSIFNDPVARQRLPELGLSKRTTFGCLYKYLFRPNAQVFSRFPAEFAALSDTFALKIGIQLRTGDLANLADASPRTSIEVFKAFFDCAHEIEETRRRPGQRVIWYFISDSLPLRSAVAAEFKGKVLVETSGVDTSHSAKETSRQGRGAVSADTYQSIAGEHWLFGMTDYQVISFDSGIGRAAAFLGHKRANTVYTIKKWWAADPPTMGEHRSCGTGDVDNYKDVAATWSLV